MVQWFGGHRLPPPEVSNDAPFDSNADAVNTLCWYCFD